MVNPKILFKTATPKNPEQVILTKAVVMEDDTSEKRKARLYQIETFTNIELLIQSLIEFKDVSKPRRLNLIAEEEKADVFRECLLDPIREAYDIARTTIRDGDEAFTFDKVVSLWISGYLTPDDYQHQLAYIRRVSKPHKVNGETIDVNFFHQRMQVILTRMTYFPSAPNSREEIMTAEEYNYAFFYAMPPAWQQKWHEKTTTPFSQTDIQELIRHFQVLWQFDEANHREYEAHMNAHSNKRKRGYKGDYKSTHAKRDSTNNGSMQDDDGTHNPCKYHDGNHTWANCFGNKNGRNYNPDFVLPEIGQWKPKRRNNNDYNRRNNDYNRRNNNDNDRRNSDYNRHDIDEDDQSEETKSTASNDDIQETESYGTDHRM
jgi:hypothetical protein